MTITVSNPKIMGILLQKKIIQMSDIHFGDETFSQDLKNNFIKPG